MQEYSLHSEYIIHVVYADRLHVGVFHWDNCQHRNEGSGSEEIGSETSVRFG